MVEKLGQPLARGAGPEAYGELLAANDVPGAEEPAIARLVPL